MRARPATHAGMLRDQLRDYEEDEGAAPAASTSAPSGDVREFKGWEKLDRTRIQVGAAIKPQLKR
jgi:hypothetical protein